MVSCLKRQGISLMPSWLVMLRTCLRQALTCCGEPCSIYVLPCQPCRWISLSRSSSFRIQRQTMSLVCCVLIEGFLSSYYTYIGSVGHQTSVGAKMRRFCRVPCHAADKICNNKDFLTTLECNLLDKIKIKTLVVSTFAFFLCYNGKRSDKKRNIVFGIFFSCCQRLRCWCKGW